MTWVKKIFRAKSDNPKSSATADEIGQVLFDLCLRNTKHFISSLDDASTKKMVNIDKENINQIELLIAYMWAFFDHLDMLHLKNYDKVLTKMHSCFINQMINYGLSEKELWQLVKMRYDEYRKIHRSQKGTSISHEKVAYNICNNILRKEVNTEFIFCSLISIDFNSKIFTMSDTFKNISITDD